ELLELQFQSAASASQGGVVVGTSDDPRVIRLFRLRQELADLLTRFTERYPDVQYVKTQIAAVEREIAEKPARAAERTPDREPPGGDASGSFASNLLGVRIRQSLTETNGELKTLKDDERRLRAAIASYEQRVTNAPRREQEMQQLSRDYLTTKDLHSTLTRRYEEAQIAEHMEQRQKGEQFRILDPAVPSLEPA